MSVWPKIIGGNEVVSILLATQLFISYVNILDYTFDMLPMLEERDVTCLQPVPFFPLRKPFDTFSEARLQIPSPTAEFLRRRPYIYNTPHSQMYKNIGIIMYYFWTFWILFPSETNIYWKILNYNEIYIKKTFPYIWETSAYIFFSILQYMHGPCMIDT